MRCATLFVACVVIASTATADDWPQFLGPKRTGVSSETGLLQNWPPDGPKELWRVPCVGGLSGVAVVGDRAFTIVQEATQQVAAFDVRTGKLLWSTPVADAYKNQMGNGPRATPTVVDGTVYAYTGNGALIALEAKSGQLRWKQTLVDDLGAKSADYGMASSPLVHGDLVIVAAGASGAAVVACEIATGKVRWKSGNDSAGYSSPIVAVIGGVSQVIAFTGSSVGGYAFETGEQIWSYRFVTDYECNIAVPLVIGDKVLISAGENHGSVMLQPTADSVKEVWKSFGKSSSLRAEWQTPVRIGQHLYGLDNQGSAGPITNLNCVDVGTGKRVWQERRFGKSNLTLADGRLWFSTMKGQLILAESSPDGLKKLGAKRYVGMTRQAPTIANGRLFLRDETELVCLDIRRQ